MPVSLSFSKFKLRTITIGVALVSAALLAYLATPRLKEDTASVEIEANTPAVVGQWRQLPNASIQVGLSTASEDINQPYDQTVMKTFTDGDGHVIYLALAWGRHQRQEVKIHRPELCYPAQGLAVESIKSITFPLTAPGQTSLIPGKRLITSKGGGQVELVSYWIRIGSSYSSSAWQTRLHIMQEGLAGKVTDGILVRVSQRVARDQNFEAEFARQEQFIAELYKASPAQLQHILAR